MLHNPNTSHVIQSLNNNAEIMATGMLPYVTGGSPKDLDTSKNFLRASQGGLGSDPTNPNPASAKSTERGDT